MMIPAPGIVVVVPDSSEQKRGDIVIASSAVVGDNVAMGKVVSVGPARSTENADLGEMGLVKDMLVYYTSNGAREIGEFVAVDHSCILAWE